MSAQGNALGTSNSQSDSPEGAALIVFSGSSFMMSNPMRIARLTQCHVVGIVF